MWQQTHAHQGLFLSGQSLGLTALSSRASHAEVRGTTFLLWDQGLLCHFAFLTGSCISHSTFLIYIPLLAPSVVCRLLSTDMRELARLLETLCPSENHARVCSDICRVKVMGCFDLYWGLFLTPKLGFSYSSHWNWTHWSDIYILNLSLTKQFELNYICVPSKLFKPSSYLLFLWHEPQGTGAGQHRQVGPCSVQD